MRRARLRRLPASSIIFALALGAGPLVGPAAGAEPVPAPETAATPEAVPVPEALPAEGNTPLLVDRIVAIVDEESILQSDLERETELYRLERQYAGEEITASDATVRREVLDRLIESKLIIAAAKQADMSVDQEAIAGSVEEKIQQFVERFGSLGALEAELVRSGMTLADYRARMASQLRDQQFLRLVVGKFIRPDIEVMENEVRDYYQAHLAEMPSEPDSVTIADILVAVQPSREARQLVQQKVSRIQAALSRGMSFPEAAKSFSEDAAAARGGVVGVVAKGDLYDDGLARAVFTLKVGQVSEPVVTTRGVHIVRVDAEQADGRRAISQIFLPISVTEQDVAAAKSAAEAARARVSGGEAFSLVAADVSADAASARNGGTLGTFRLEDLSESFQKALVDLPVDGVSEPVMTPAGWYVFKMVARKDGHTFTYDEIAEQLRQAVESQKIEAALATYVKDLRKRFFIEEKG